MKYTVNLLILEKNTEGNLLTDEPALKLQKKCWDHIDLLRVLREFSLSVEQHYREHICNCVATIEVIPSKE